MSSARQQTIVQYSILVAASLFAYGGSLHGTFVFDDSAAIVKNMDVRNVATPFRTLLRHDFWGNNLTDPTSHKSFRPLTVLSYQLESRFLGLNAGHMKKLNLALHTICSLLVLRLFQILCSEDGHRFRTAFWGAFLFTVHPVHTEAVVGIVGRADLLAAIGYLTIMLLYLRWIESDHCQRWGFIVYPVLFALTIISMLCKETGIMALVSCGAVDILKRIKWPLRGTVHELLHAHRTSLGRVIILAALSLGALALRLWIMDFESPRFHRMDNPVGASNSTLARVLSQSYLYWINLWLLVCPDWLSFDWALGSIPLIEGLSDLRLLLVALFYGFIALLLLRVPSTKRNEVTLSLVLAIIPFVPACGIVRVGFVIAERLLYLPSVGFCYLIAIGCRRLIKRSFLFYIPLCFLCTVFILKTQSRAHEWTNEDLLFRSALRVCPGNAKVYYNIARLATDQGDRKTAFAFYRHAIALHPDYEAAHMNLGNLYRETGDLDTAETHLLKAIQIHEPFPSAWMNLGIVQAAQRNHDAALQSYQRALQLKPNYANCLYNLGNLYIDMQNSTMALRYWREAIQQNPRHSKAWANILALYDNRGRTEDIIRTSELALSFLPNDTAILFTRANAYGKLAQYEKAESLYRQIIAARPDYAVYRANLGVLYHRWGQRESQAIEQYRAALRIDPNLRSAKTNLLKLMGTT
ncbi:protein O-mannosyl-transferase TMTC4-like [Anopheles albimanus]|uniref:dolichyl-phosphate-mannose--protein mannosyltransferase n=1 Tax=Anopheles albimanus TaxID=7167 RepID=A0A182F7X3_ANOAL|nr:protein O-mannosyl-transferase TMTC4-like [Anopheles albimanus]XP_035773765.1 protein O-mannosyl-transferase TMTC4-like [Anopheles albimanus]